jgi:hypothetical protein
VCHLSKKLKNIAEGPIRTPKFQFSGDGMPKSHASASQQLRAGATVILNAAIPEAAESGVLVPESGQRTLSTLSLARECMIPRTCKSANLQICLSAELWFLWHISVPEGLVLSSTASPHNCLKRVVLAEAFLRFGRNRLEEMRCNAC